MKKIFRFLLPLIVPAAAFAQGPGPVPVFPGPPNGAIQYDNAGHFGGMAGALTNGVNLTFTAGKITTTASATGAAGFELPPGTAPSSPVNGDLWTTSAGFYARINGATELLGSLVSVSNSDGTLTISPTTGAVVASLALSLPNSWTGAQRETPVTISISTTTYTPNFDTGQNFTINLTSACASAACTLANPSTTLVPGQAGVIEFTQPASGGPAAIGTWGSEYYYAGGTRTIGFSTGANDPDYLSYYVDANSHIVLTTAALNPTH